MTLNYANDELDDHPQDFCGDFAHDLCEAELIKVVSEYSDELERGLRLSPETFASRVPHADQRLLEMLRSVHLLHNATAEANAMQSSPSAKIHNSHGASDWELNKLLQEEGGRMLGGYRLLREIGRGAMGIVYEAEQVGLSRKVAVKVLPPAAMLDERQIARFSLESQTAAKLQHPHIVPVHDVGCDGGIYYYSMQRIETSELLFPLNPDEAARIGECVARALHHAHQEGVIHRDIKPTNLLLDRQRKVWVTDFGLARLLKNDQSSVSNAIVGTMRYMSPEQACGNSKWVDHRTDIYALGVTLYEMLAGRCPFDSSDRVLFLAELERGEPTHLRKINSKIPVDLETIVLKAMSVHPNDRYSTAAELANDLQRFLAGEVIYARRPSHFDRLAKWTRRNQRWVSVGVATWLLFTIALVITSVRLMRSEQQTRLANSQSQTSMQEANAFFSQARNVVDHFGISLSRELSQVPGAEQARFQVLRDTLKYYRDFIEQVGSNPSRKSDLASTHLKIARIAEHLGAVDEAIEAYQNSESILLSVPNSEKDRALCANSLGLLLTRCQRYAEADDAYRRAISLNEMRSSSSSSDTREHFEAVQQQAITYANRARLQELLHNPQESLSALLQADRLQQTILTQPDLPNRSRLALLLECAKTSGALSRQYARRDPAKAIDLNAKAINHLREYRGLCGNERQPIATESLDEAYSDLVVALCNHGVLLREQGDLDEAIASTSEAIALARQMVEKQPGNPNHRTSLISALTQKGKLLSKTGGTSIQLNCFREAREQATTLADLYPNSESCQINAASAMFNLGMAAKSVGQPTIVEECIESLRVLMSEPRERHASSARLIRQRIRDLESWNAETSQTLPFREGRTCQLPGRASSGLGILPGNENHAGGAAWHTTCTEGIQ